MITGLSIESVSITRGDRTLFEDLSLKIGKGEAVALVGANGAGKTSLLRCVAGFIRPAAGKVTFEGADADDARRGALHFLGHQDGLKSGRRARDELAFQVRWTGGSEADIAGVVERLGLGPLLDLEVRKLSGASCRPDNGGAWRWPGWWLLSGRFGCSTSPWRRWTPNAGRCSAN
jgi:heme exporter protein A